MLQGLGWFRGWLIIIMAGTLFILQRKFPFEAWLSIWPPVFIVLAAGLMYRQQLKNYNWEGMKTGSFWESVGFALTQGIILQAAGNVIVMYGLRVEQPQVHMELTLPIWISAVVFSAILEEVLYRKIIFSTLDRFIGFWPSAVISSALFAVSHYNYSAYLGYFLLGLVWCRAYKKSGNLGVVIAAHIAFNAIAFFVMGLRG